VHKKPAIYICRSKGPAAGDSTAIAVTEDGHVVAHHVSSSRDWCRIDMGLHPISPNGSRNKRGQYEAHYPDGYELVDMTDFTTAQLDDLSLTDARVQAVQAAWDRYRDREREAAAKAGEAAAIKVAGMCAVVGVFP